MAARPGACRGALAKIMMTTVHIPNWLAQSSSEGNQARRHGISVDFDNCDALGLAPFGTRGYAVGESSIWSLCARCGQMKVSA
jgi:hypothetical protein